MDLDLTQSPPATFVAQGGGGSGIFDACVAGWDCGMGLVASNTFSRLMVLYHLVLGELWVMVKTPSSLGSSIKTVDVSNASLILTFGS